MVDRIGNGSGYGYPQVSEKKMNSKITGADEKFQLDYGKEGAIYEPGSETLKRQQEQKGVSRNDQTYEKQRLEDEGVRLTLSEGALDSKAKAIGGEERTTGGFLEKVTDIVNKAFQVIKNFFISIWNEEAPKDTDSTVTEGNAEPEMAASRTDVAHTEKPKTQFEKAKAEAEAFLSSSEGKKAARNSDLLTYYDRRGTVVQVSPSDRQRILYGDKNQIEV